jgi:hypothetical protein
MRNPAFHQIGKITIIPGNPGIIEQFTKNLTGRAHKHAIFLILLFPR